MGPSVGFDTVTPSDLFGLVARPGTPHIALGGYPDGIFADEAQIKAEYPHAIVYGYAVRASDDGDILDIERGDAVPSQAPGWYRRQKPRVFRVPGLYCSASVVAEVIAEMHQAGIPREDYLIVSAHFGIGPHICGPHTCGFPQADSSQWTDTGPHGENVDRLLFSESCWPQKPLQSAHGLAVARLTYDSDRFSWHIEHEHGTFQHGDFDHWASCEVQHNQKTNQWRVHRMPWNAKPLGG